MRTCLTPAEIKTMISKAPCLRDKAIITFLADTGVRVSEMLQLKETDVDFEKKLVLIPHLKRGIRKKCPECGRPGGRSQKFCSRCGVDLTSIEAEGIEERSRLVSIGAITAEILREYCDLRTSETEILFALTRQRVGQILREVAELSGLGGKTMLNPETGKMHFVHPHNLRGSLAVDWLTYAGENATKQKALQEHLGHKRYETTMKYLALLPSAVAKVSEEVREQRFK